MMMMTIIVLPQHKYNSHPKVTITALLQFFHIVLSLSQQVNVTEGFNDVMWGIGMSKYLAQGDTIMWQIQDGN